MNTTVVNVSSSLEGAGSTSNQVVLELKSIIIPLLAVAKSFSGSSKAKGSRNSLDGVSGKDRANAGKANVDTLIHAFHSLSDDLSTLDKETSALLIDLRNLLERSLLDPLDIDGDRGIDARRSDWNTIINRIHHILRLRPQLAHHLSSFFTSLIAIVDDIANDEYLHQVAHAVVAVEEAFTGLMLEVGKKVVRGKRGIRDDLIEWAIRRAGEVLSEVINQATLPL